MSDYITLLGSEDVARAARQMDEAADTMRRAANTIDEAISRLALLLDEHANRIEAAIKGGT